MPFHLYPLSITLHSLFFSSNYIVSTQKPKTFYTFVGTQLSKAMLFKEDRVNFSRYNLNTRTQLLTYKRNRKHFSGTYMFQVLLKTKRNPTIDNQP